MKGCEKVPKPSNYEAKVLPNLAKIKTARINGASMQDIADMLGVAASTLYNYTARHPEFREAMDEATFQMHSTIESVANQSLLNKLQDRMVTTEQIIEDGVITKEKRQLVKADTVAIIFALKARNPGKWDPLGVARVEQKEQEDDLGQQIKDMLSQYTVTPVTDQSDKNKGDKK
nr:MAG TPA: terminase small subunit [Caudoviricetes sp.]